MRLEDVVLALIELHPGVTGYDLASIIRTNVSRFYSTTLSQIYPALRSLTSQGLVEFEDQTSDGGRAKKAYTITGAGREHLTRFYATPTAYGGEFADFGHFLLLAILLPGAEDAQVRQRLAEARDGFAAQRDHVAARRSLDREISFARLSGPRADRYMALWNPIMDYLLADYGLKIAWLDSLLEGLPLPGTASPARNQQPVGSGGTAPFTDADGGAHAP
jgi:DNA-binding PadR family transcriptional regulator